MTAHRRALFIGGAFALVFVVLRVVPYLGANLGGGIDSIEYRSLSRLPVLSRDFLGGTRPFGYPLYLKVTRDNLHAAGLGQLLLSIVAWLALAWSAVRVTRHTVVRYVVAGVVLGLGATFEVIQWDRVVSTEALSIATGVGTLAALLWLYERWTWPRLAVTLILALGMTVTRDTNGTFLGVVAIVLLIGVVVRRVPVHALALVLGFVVLAGLASASSTAGKRWEIPLRDVISLRILNSPERTAFFQREGMPLSAEEIDAVRGNCIGPGLSPFCKTVDPRFHHWIHTDGREVYAKSLVKFPATTVWEPVAHLRDSIGARPRVEIGAGTDEHAPVSKFLEAVLLFRNPLLAAIAGLLVLGLCVAGYATGLRGAFVVAGAMLALTYPHLWLVWVGGAEEVARHSLLANLQLHLGIWLGALWLVDARLTGHAAPNLSSSPNSLQE